MPRPIFGLLRVIRYRVEPAGKVRLCPQRHEGGSNFRAFEAPARTVRCEIDAAPATPVTVF
jgi:hypothetical protein